MTRFLHITILALSVLLCGLLIFAWLCLPNAAPSVSNTSSSPEETVPSGTEASTIPTVAPIKKESIATLGATGDILLHKNVIRSGYEKSTDSYDYSHFFQYLTDYIKKLDYAIGNMEGTLAGNEDGYAYTGHPQFNAPDAIAVAAKNAGFDMLLTANNHAYDTRTLGFHRTQQVISNLGLDHIGTRPTIDVKNYMVKNINGIHIGISCYTYDTRHETSDRISLNGISMSAQDAPLINTFNENHLDAFYQNYQQEIAAMKADGAEVILLFIHWGDEYRITPNKTQKAMAQKLCDLGVDVIIGGHPHVIQPMEILTNSLHPEKSTVCLYSMGNSVSNIRGANYPLETMDCMFFTLTFAKYSDGSVLVEKAEVLPYYVNRYAYTSAIPYRYPLVPLHLPQEQWKNLYQLNDEMFAQCQASLIRTNAILADGLASVNSFLAQQQTQLETRLGINPL